MALLCLARATVTLLPFRRWRERIGLRDGDSRCDRGTARLLSAHVERAARRLPFLTKCLPRALTLSWMLRRRGIGHSVVVAIRPENRRDQADSLHAWVEAEGMIVLGDLPGPWHEIYRRPHKSGDWPGRAS